MIIYPAIDLRQGRVVRLVHGDPERETVHSDDPAATAERWKAAGAALLHVVNLDGAFGEGDGLNQQALRRMVARVAQWQPDVAVHLGGGLRTFGQLEQALSCGVRRVVLGTAAIEQPELVRGPDRTRHYAARR